MKKQQGLTLVEILLSLSLISGFSMGLLSQSNRLALSVNQKIQDFYKLLKDTNHLEQAFKP